MNRLNHSREIKADGISAVAALLGIGLLVVSSEIGAPIILGIGVGAVAVATVARVINFRHTHQASEQNPDDLAKGRWS